MQVASVVGKDFTFRILQTITGMREELKSYLLNLQGLEFIYEKSLFPELEYVFKHALTQEVAYNSLLLKRRNEIHERIGRAIEKLYPDRLEEFYEMLAYHYSKSKNLEKSYQYLKLSGNKAMKNYSNWEAFRYYKKAIQVLTKMPETAENKKEQIEVRLSITGPMMFLHWPEESYKNLRESERLSKELGDLKTARAFIEKALNFFSTAEVEIDLGLFYWLLGAIHLETGDLKNAQCRAEQSLKISQKTHQKWIESFAWILLGRITGKAEKPKAKKGEDTILQGLKILDELKLKALYAPGYHYLGELYVDTGQKDKAPETLKKAEKMFQEVGMNYWLTKTNEVLDRL